MWILKGWKLILCDVLQMAEISEMSCVARYMYDHGPNMCVAGALCKIYVHERLKFK